jgi:hypothetical protein
MTGPMTGPMTGAPTGRMSGATPGPTTGRRIAAVAGLLAAAVAGSTGGWVLGHQGSGGPAPGSNATGASGGTAAPSASSSATRSSELADVAQLQSPAAAAELEQAGLRTKGTPVEACSWTDANGRNILLATKTVDRRDGAVVRAATLHVYHAAELGGSARMLLTPLRDPGTVPCDLDFNLDFVPGSIQVTDADRDGYGEATVGWWSSCRGDPGPERLKLALLTKGTYFILRGSGLVASQPPLPSGVPAPPATFAPNLPENRWPAGSYTSTVALFRRLFR